MKALKYFVYTLALAASLSTTLVACGKKSDDSATNLTVGSLVSDGNNVTSTSTVGGYQLALQINNITAYNSGCYYQYGQQVCNNQLNFMVVANNQQAQVSSKPRYIGTSSADQRTQTNIGQFQVVHQSACYDAACTSIAVEVIIGNGYEYKQVVIKKDMSSNKIVNMTEALVNAQTARPLSVIMQTL